jgi:acetyltransferase
LCFIDYDREMALVVIDMQQTDPRLVAVARLSKLAVTRDAEFALVLSDEYQRAGLGTELLRRLIAIGRDQNLSRIVGYINASNQPMTAVCRRLGFQFHSKSGDTTLVASLEL